MMRNSSHNKEEQEPKKAPSLLTLASEEFHEADTELHCMELSKQLSQMEMDQSAMKVCCNL